MPCFYAPNLDRDSREIQITGTEHHHIYHVFRKKIGDEILLTSGSGVLAKATINQINKHELIAEIIEIEQPILSPPHISVAVPLLKNKHDNLIIEKLTELGVKEFYPIITERTVRKPGKNLKDKFYKVAIAAIKQCDNAYLPIIHDTLSLSDLIQELPDGVLPVAALEVGDHPIISQQVKPNESVCIIIGPEGGFTLEEIEFLKDNSVRTISLGNHILRAETAAITAVSQLLVLYLTENSDYY